MGKQQRSMWYLTWQRTSLVDEVGKNGETMCDDISIIPYEALFLLVLSHVEAKVLMPQMSYNFSL